MAAREGRSGFEVFYDRMLEQEGRQIFLAPLLNYSDYSLDPTYEMLTHPHTVVSLGDAGAHCGVICDASGPTTLLSFWTRDRTRGATIPLERAVKMCTQDTASLYGLHDRGVIRPGMLADLNVIDYDALRLRLPEFHHDLPAGGGRWVQKADGYRYTIKRGVVIMRDGAPSGPLAGAADPGRAGGSRGGVGRRGRRPASPDPRRGGGRRSATSTALSGAGNGGPGPGWRGARGWGGRGGRCGG